MPALKLSQPLTAFCAISRTQAVEESESQGCLPHQTFMQTQAIDTAAKASAQVADRASVRSSESPTRHLSRWSCLPLQQLNNFDLVSYQFADQQVWFDAAIALRPSNPYFQAGESSLTLMADTPTASFKVRLGQDITEVDFGYISSAPLTITCLDDQGHCVAIVKTTKPAPKLQPQVSESQQYAIQGIALNTGNATTLRIDSTAPFVLTRFWVKQG